MNNAEKFIELIEDGKIRKHVLPNTAPDYSIYQEEKDLQDYLFFINSFALDELMNCEVACYNGDEQV